MTAAYQTQLVMGDTPSTSTHGQFTPDDRKILNQILDFVCEQSKDLREQRKDLKGLLEQIDIERSAAADTSDASTQTDPTEADLFGESDDDPTEPKAKEPNELEAPDAPDTKESNELDAPTAKEPDESDAQSEASDAKSDESVKKAPKAKAKAPKEITEEMLAKEVEKRDKAIEKAAKCQDTVDASQKKVAELQAKLDESDEKFAKQLDNPKATEKKKDEIRDKQEIARLKFNTQLRAAEAKVVDTIAKRDAADQDVTKKEASLAKMEKAMREA